MSFVKVLGEGLMLHVSEEDKQELLVARSQAARGPRRQGRSVLLWGGRAAASDCGVVSELTTGRHPRAQRCALFSPYVPFARS